MLIMFLSIVLLSCLYMCLVMKQDERKRKELELESLNNRNYNGCHYHRYTER